MKVLRTRHVATLALVGLLWGCTGGSPPVIEPLVGATAAPLTSPVAAPIVVPPGKTWHGDRPVSAFTVPKKPPLPHTLPTQAAGERVGAVCRDGSHSDATGRGACSHHRGVAQWLVDVPSWVATNQTLNATRLAAYKAATSARVAALAKNALIKQYPCRNRTYPKGRPGYAPWRDSNRNGRACEPYILK